MAEILSPRTIMIILTMVIALYSNSLTTIKVEYSTLEKCEGAKKINRQALSDGKVILATCTPK